MTDLFDDVVDNQVEREEEADQLEEDILILNKLYEDGNPTILPRTGKLISDPEFDRLTEQLKKLRPASDVLLEITGVSPDDIPGAKKVKLNPPMASINKAIGKLEVKTALLKKWLADAIDELVSHGDVIKISPGLTMTHAGQTSSNADIADLCEAKFADGTPVFVMSYKRDGVAAALVYEKGELVSGALRPRDGINSIDVVEHVKFAKGVPTKLAIPLTCSIRGEMECLLPDFEKVNATGDRVFANPRNMTAGAMNPQGEPKVVRDRRVSFIAHSIEGLDNPPYKTAIERAKWTNKTLGVKFVRVEPLQFAKLAELETLSKDLEYETDGIVVEVNWLIAAEAMGRHGGAPNGNPKWKLAWKFKEQTATPEIKSVVWETGRTGRVVPVAHFDPVRLAGTNVSKCTLHNLGFVQRFMAGIGAVIEIEKSGKIIPKALRTISPAKSINPPKICPSCSSKLTIIEGESKDEAGKKIKTFDLLCEETSCPAQNLGTLVHYLRTFGVKGVAESNVSAAVVAGLVKTYADFYKLTEVEWQSAGLSEREAVLAYARIHMIEGADKVKDNAKLLTAAKKAGSKKLVISLHQLIAALGIPGASKGTGRDLASHFGSLKAIRSASVEQLEAAPNIGNTTATGVYDWMALHVKEVDALLKHIEPEGPKQGKFSGMSFVFTGSPAEETKEYWMKKVENEGAKISTSVSKTTNYVVIGSDAGQKADKARELKAKGSPINIIEDLADLRKLLGMPVAPDDRLF